MTEKYIYNFTQIGCLWSSFLSIDSLSLLGHVMVPFTTICVHTCFNVVLLTYQHTLYTRVFMSYQTFLLTTIVIVFFKLLDFPICRCLAFLMNVTCVQCMLVCEEHNIKTRVYNVCWYVRSTTLKHVCTMYVGM
jgi:hypothetical protein